VPAAQSVISREDYMFFVQGLCVAAQKVTFWGILALSVTKSLNGFSP
jgi:hypothetical protein